MLVLDSPPMAKKKPTKPPELIRKPVVSQFRGTEEFKVWVDDLARKESLPTSSLIERALKLYAKSVGHDVPAPKR